MIVLVIAIAVYVFSCDIVEEGYIGVYYRGSALLEGYVDPGIHFKNALTTKMYQVQVTVQTDEVKHIPVRERLMKVWYIWWSQDIL